MLNSEIYFYEDFTNIFIALGVSAIASCVLKYTDEIDKDFLLSFGLLFFFCLVLALISVCKYISKGHSGLYGYNVDQYEQYLLQKIIRKVEKQLCCGENEKEIIEKKQIVIDLLVDIGGYSRKKNKKRKGLKRTDKINRKEIEKDINRIYALDLGVTDEKIEWKKVSIGEKDILLPYIKKENISCQYNLQGYGAFYEILDKYKLYKIVNTSF